MTEENTEPVVAEEKLDKNGKPKEKTTPQKFALQIVFGLAMAALIMSQSTNIWNFWWDCIWVPMLALFGLKPS